MDPISTSQFSHEANQSLTCGNFISGVVATVSAVAVAIFAISTYCIITYGAPLAIVAFVANPVVAVGITAAATLVFIIAISVLCSKPKQIIIEKKESENLTKFTCKPDNEHIGIQKTKVEKENKPVKFKIENSEALHESNHSISVSEPHQQPTVNVEIKLNVPHVFSDILTDETSENEKIEALAKVPLSEIQEYIEKQNSGYQATKKQFFLLPTKILSQLDASKFSNEQVSWLCFGENMDYSSLKIQIKQTRFEALIGNSEFLGKFYDDPVFSPFVSATQLKYLSSFEGYSNFYETFCTPTKLNQFFPVYCKEILTENERERFSNLFDAHDVEFMLDRGGALEFPSKLVTDPSPGDDILYRDFHKDNECRTFRSNWKYYLQLIPTEYVKSIDFSFNTVESSLLDTVEGRFRFNPFQVIFMLQDFSTSQFNSLTSEQIVQIKRRYEYIYYIIQKNDDNSTKIKYFLTYYWNEYLHSLYAIYPEKEAKKIADFVFYFRSFKSASTDQVSLT
ncbi:MAG: hypothetical protein H0T62_05215 [Parachlamydiaceae bacterium]|nr:hypothetical protein [Parachlamydiaceae bacterium]